MTADNHDHDDEVEVEVVTETTTVRGGFSLAEVRKTVITGIGMLIAVGAFVLDAATAFLPPGWAEGIAIGVGGLTVVLNYLAPNETTNVERAVGRSVRLKGQKPVKAAPKLADAA
ncbi:membrane protein [Mycobacterium phage Thonko]|uniref:Membrane protein n=1 Tax=Mycobacterium phage Thonko TaxID=2282910 RepID=A0A346FC63_9CAUD|nr:membrane protein [Mycobacterium phage Thonko]AXN53288.1 membrane protein [Mycobacterium phage Thonko]